MAQRFRITILGGGFPVPLDGGKVYNTALLIDSNGQELSRYQKYIYLMSICLTATPIKNLILSWLAPSCPGLCFQRVR
jgi:hypothetical protein